MNINKDIPDDKSYFSVNVLDEDSPLIKLLEVLKENGSSYETAQAAIWHITDNPGRETILTSLEYEDDDGNREWAISEEDYDEALRLIELSGGQVRED